MKIRYLGTAAAEGVPAMFCNCDFCNKIRKLGYAEFRTRTQVIIDNKISIDFPPEAYAHSLKYGMELSALKYLLVTHSHMDHFYAHDFVLRGYKYGKLKEPVLKIYGNSEVKNVFDECTAREMKKEVAPNIDFNVAKPNEIWTMGGYKVITIPASHNTIENALLYYIERAGKGYLHFYDTGLIDISALDFLAENGAKASLVSLDCTFGAEYTAGVGARHMGIEDCAEMRKRLLSSGIADENTGFVITHFSHHCNPTRQNLKTIEKKYNMIAAYDGMEIEF